jgi:integrase
LGDRGTRRPLRRSGLGLDYGSRNPDQPLQHQAALTCITPQESRSPHIRFHDLRHTCATLLLSKAVHPKFVQELLGHATIAITLDTYSHFIPSMGDQTARAMQDALSPIDEALTD